MNRYVRWLEAAQWALMAAMFAASALSWATVPDSIPVHWGLDGRVDRYGGKIEGLFLLPAISLVVVLTLRYLPRIDPRRARYAEFWGAYAVARTAIVALLACAHAIVVLAAHGAAVNAVGVIAPLVGVLFVILGAVLDQVRPNWFFGIRTPWTLTSELSWRATHRAGRWIFVAIGLAIALAGLTGAGWALVAALTVGGVGLLGLVIYSYAVWRDDPARQTA